MPFYLVVSPQSSQSIGIHYPEYFGFFVLPSDEVFVPAVRKQLIDVIPQQSAVCREKGQGKLCEMRLQHGQAMEKTPAKADVGLTSLLHREETECQRSSEVVLGTFDF